MLNSESANAKFPFSKVPENFVVGVGTGVAVGVAVGVEIGVAVGLGVGEGDVVVVRVEVGVGEGDGEVVIVGVKVAVPEPGQVCDRRIPESKPLIVANEPTWTIRSLSFVKVYTYAPLPNCTRAPDLITNFVPSVFIKIILRLTDTFGLVGLAWKVAPREVRTRCHASYPVSYPGK